MSHLNSTHTGIRFNFLQYTLAQKYYLEKKAFKIFQTGYFQNHTVIYFDKQEAFKDGKKCIVF